MTLYSHEANAVTEAVGTAREPKKETNDRIGSRHTQLFALTAYFISPYSAAGAATWWDQETRTGQTHRGCRHSRTMEECRRMGW